MASVVDIVSDYLSGLGIAGSYTFARGFEPPEPDEIITVVEFGGQSPDTTFGAEYPAFQVRVRGKAWDYVSTRDKIQEVFEAVHGQDGVVGNSGEALVYVAADQQPFPVDQDELDRITFVFNCRSMRTPT